MGGWYRVVKTIKGHRYVYEQQTWREDGHVRTRNRYIGRAAETEEKEAQQAVTALSFIYTGHASKFRRYLPWKR